MDVLLRALSYLLVGTALLIANLWFIQAVRQALLGQALVIAPFQVSGAAPEAAGLGGSLAQMLQARLGHLQHRLAASQESLVGAPPVGAAASVAANARALVLLRPVLMPTAVLEPVSIDVKLAGVEVGGAFTWLQRSLVKPRTLTFTAYVAQRETAAGGVAPPARAIVTGDVQALSASASRPFWLETAASAEAIVDATAHALIQRRLSEMGLNEIEAFDVQEFGSLLDSLFALAELNRRVASGRSAGDGFAKLVAPLSSLVEKAPEWFELKFLAAHVEENAGRTDLALGHYRELNQLGQAREGTPRGVDQALRARVEERLRDLSSAAAHLAPPAEVAFLASASAYGRRLNLPGEDPQIVFRPSDQGTIAFWNSEERQYEIDPAQGDYRGLDRYVALMGRFMAKHYERCFARGDPSPAALEVWQEFRSSLVEYVISTDTDTPGPSDQRAYGMALFKSLQRLEAGSSRDTVRRLALTLLDRYDCGWTSKNLPAEILKVAAELGAPTEEAVRAVLAVHDR